MAMFENIGGFFKRFMQNEKKELLVENTTLQSKETAKDRLHVVLMQDRANVSADFLEMMKEEIIEVIKKYIVVDETKIDVRLTNEENEDGSIGVPLLHANIPILNIRNDLKGELSNNVENNSEAEILDNDMDKTQIIRVVKEDLEDSKNIEENDSVNVEQENELVDNNIEDNTQIFEVSTDVENENIESEVENENNQEEQLENIEEKVEEKIEETVNEEPISLEDKINELDDEFEEDDDVTFDDLLKAAEEEEERLKKLEENKESEEKSEIEENVEEKPEKKESKKTTKKSSSSSKKKKTSKTKKK